MGAVWAYVEYGWNLKPQIGLKTTESGAHNPIGIDGINAESSIVLFQPAWQSLDSERFRATPRTCGRFRGILSLR
jgi:hypothetical protein